MSVVATGVVPTYVSDLGLQLWPDRRVDVPWSIASKLVDRRLARVVGFHNLDSFEALPYVYWLSPFSQGDGYATAAESMAHWLMELGLKLSVHHSWFLVKDGLRPGILQELERPLDKDCAIGICMATPGEFEKLPTPMRVGFTMYEASNPLRVYPEWRHQCNNVDVLFVPSVYCKEVFSQFTRVPIHIVPLAIHEDYCTPVMRQPRGKFRIVTFATLTERKSPLEMIEVFRRAFPHEPDVEFVLKTRLNMLGDVKDKLPTVDDHRVRVVSGTWSRTKIHRLLDSADCMLFLSKGEGFGMTPREAMATGLPVILADNSGMSDVCNSRYNWPVPTKSFERSPLGGDWAIPDWDHAVEVLRDIYHNREKAYQKGLRGAEWFVKEHGPPVAAKHCVNALERLRPMHVVEQRYKRDSGLPELAPVPEVVQDELRHTLNGTPVVVVKEYRALDAVYVKGCCAVVGQRLASMNRDQLRHAVNRLLSAGATSVAIMVPSVYSDINQWSVSRAWRMEELQHVLKGLYVMAFRYTMSHTWILAVVSRTRGSYVMQGFGSVVDGRWKPT